MENKNLYIFIGKIALEFRLSLANVCKLLGKEITEENKMSIYNTLLSLSDNNRDLKNMYNYLFFYETITEPENISKTAHMRAVNYIKRYNKIKKEGTQDQLKEILKELNKTEYDFNNIKDKIGKVTLNQDEIDIISKYRIKRVISRIQFSNYYNINRSNIEKREKNSSDSILKNKLVQLGEFFYHFENQRLRKK